MKCQARMYPDSLSTEHGSMLPTLRTRLATVILAGCCTLVVGLSSLAQENNIPVEGRRLKGSSRPEVIVKTKVDTKCDANKGVNVGFAGTFDTGSDDTVLTPANLTALGLPGDGSSVSPNVGGVINYQKVPPPDDGKVPEDSLTTCGNLILSKADPSKLSMGVVGFGTRVEKEDKFNALGSDFLLNGAVAVYDPNNAPKVIDMSSSGVFAADFPLGGTIVLSAAGNEGFNPKLKLTADLTRFNGSSFRPTLEATFTNGDKSKRKANALWDTGATTSQIDRKLISCKGDDDETKIPATCDAGKAKDAKRATLTTPVTFGPDGSTLTINNLQAVVADRDAGVPARIGMNVLDQFKMLIDLHQPKIWPANPKGVWGLQRTPVATGKLKPGKVREIAPVGSWVTVQYTDGTGGLLVDGNGNPISARQKVPASGKVDFDAPAGTEDFIQTIQIPAGGALSASDSQPNEIVCDGVHWQCNSLMVEAFIPRPEGYAGSREKGQPDDFLTAGFDIGSIWDALAAVVPVNEPPYVVGNIPDLFAEDGTPLYEAVELSTYLAGLEVLGYSFDKDWTEPGLEFSLEKGQVVFQNNVLPGIYVGTTPLAINYMAGGDDSFFINGQPADGLAAKSYSEHGVVLPAPSGFGGN